MSRPGLALVMTLLLVASACAACGGGVVSPPPTTHRAVTTSVPRSATGSLSSPTTTNDVAPRQHPSTTSALVPTVTTKAQLLSAFVAYKLTTGGLKMSDRVVWTAIDPPTIDGPLEAWDAYDGLFYAFGNFTLTGSPSYAAQVSFQDGGSFGVFSARPGGPWHVGLGAIPVCRNLFPAAVAVLWKLPNPPGCA